jgi:hypothetical protein
MIEYYLNQFRSPLYPEIEIAFGCAPVDTNHPAVDPLAPEFLLGQRHVDRNSSMGRRIRTDQEYLHRAAALLPDEAFLSPAGMMAEFGERQLFNLGPDVQP